MSDFKKALLAAQSRAEAALDRFLPTAGILPGRLHEAMRYSALSGGKRVRPFLTYATGEALGIDSGALDLPAAAVEMIHAYSLIHDDLPAMDDDDLRRGMPTCHRAFDEATAILAGDALQASAFRVLAHEPCDDLTASQRLAMLDILTYASGSRGMVGGQAIDLGAVGRTLTIAELEDMHIHKTGALIRAAVMMATHCSMTVSSEQRDALDAYAKCIGLAFQIRDDILDIEASTEVLGKAQGADIARDKPTYPSIIGLAASKERAEQLHERAVDALSGFGERAENLRALSEYIVRRPS